MKTLSTLLAFFIFLTSCSKVVPLTDAEISSARECLPRVQTAISELIKIGMNKAPPDYYNYEGERKRAMYGHYDILVTTEQYLKLALDPTVKDEVQLTLIRLELNEADCQSFGAIPMEAPRFAWRYKPDSSSNAKCLKIANVAEAAYGARENGVPLSSVLTTTNILDDSLSRQVTQGTITAVYGDRSLGSATDAHSKVYQACLTAGGEVIKQMR